MLYSPTCIVLVKVTKIALYLFGLNAFSRIIVFSVTPRISAALMDQQHETFLFAYKPCLAEKPVMFRKVIQF